MAMSKINFGFGMGWRPPAYEDMDTNYICFNIKCNSMVVGDKYMINNQVYCKKCYDSIKRKEKLDKINESR